MRDECRGLDLLDQEARIVVFESERGGG